MNSLLTFFCFVAIGIVGAIVIGVIVETCGWWLFVVLLFLVLTMKGDKG